MKKTVVFWGLLLTFFATELSAQITHTSKGAVDQNAEKVLKESARVVNAAPVSFVVTMINHDADGKETARKKANVLYYKGKYRVSFDNNVIYCDGKTSWHWNKDANEVVVNNVVSSDDDLMNPAAILSSYSNNFKAKYIRNEEATKTVVIDLTPYKAKSYHKIRLLVSQSTHWPSSMTLHNYDGTRGEYRMGEFKSGVKVSDSDFRFQTESNKNVEVIDMR